MGVDLTPYKTCSQDCVFCQLGRTPKKTLTRHEYVPMEKVLEELEEWLGWDCGFGLLTATHPIVDVDITDDLTITGPGADQLTIDGNAASGIFAIDDGTLGVITEVEVLLAPRPEGVLSALAFFPSDDEALAFVRQARGDPDCDPRPEPVAPIALELFDSRSFDFLRERKGKAGRMKERRVDAGAKKA